MKSSGDTLKSIFIFHICIYLYFLRFDFTSETDFFPRSEFNNIFKRKKNVVFNSFPVSASGS